jgi:hypothetical protein
VADGGDHCRGLPVVGWENYDKRQNSIPSRTLTFGKAAEAINEKPAEAG